ncbi:MAG TPA: F0F1 ATP synthase subunit epsilon, partial [Terriglobales bacterium]|nr:F0F1 ATP synthase subunit epsilon [Terriglobales bacterium]
SLQCAERLLGDKARLVSHTFELVLEIVTPGRLLVRSSAKEVQIPGNNGYLGILPGHAPLITELGIGEITYRENGQAHSLAVAWGFAEVLPERVTILAETAEHAGEIDVRREEQAKKRAEQRLTSSDPSVDCARAQRALTRATSRLQVAQRQQTAKSESRLP